jgi:hypothetical protein
LFGGDCGSVCHAKRRAKRAMYVHLGRRAFTRSAWNIFLVGGKRMGCHQANRIICARSMRTLRSVQRSTHSPPSTSGAGRCSYSFGIRFLALNRNWRRYLQRDPTRRQASLGSLSGKPRKTRLLHFCHTNPVCGRTSTPQSVAQTKHRRRHRVAGMPGVLSACRLARYTSSAARAD